MTDNVDERDLWGDTPYFPYRQGQEDKGMLAFVVISGDLLEGIKYCRGPFRDEETALTYLESHNLGHHDKFVLRVDRP